MRLLYQKVSLSLSGSQNFRILRHIGLSHVILDILRQSYLRHVNLYKSFFSVVCCYSRSSRIIYESYLKFLGVGIRLKYLWICHNVLYVVQLIYLYTFYIYIYNIIKLISPLVVCSSLPSCY